MAGRETLSLLIPAYNASWCLPRLLRSAQNQTIAFDEIWVYDDCSSDETAAIAKAHGAKVLRGAVNVGCSAGKNALAEHVVTDWVHFHDADDELLPNFVAAARRWIDRGDRDVVLFSYEWRDNETGEVLKRISFDDQALRDDPRAYAIRTQINPFCGLYRRTAIMRAGGYDTDPQVLYNEDVAFHIRLAFAGLAFGADSETTVINYRVGGSMSASNLTKCIVAQYHVMARSLQFDGAEIYQKDFGSNLWNISARLASVGETALARSCARLARRNCLPPTTSGRLYFRALASVFPATALLMREYLIRSFRPGLRGSPASSNRP